MAYHKGLNILLTTSMSLGLAGCGLGSPTPEQTVSPPVVTPTPGRTSLPPGWGLNACPAPETYVLTELPPPPDTMLEHPCEVAANMQRQLVDEHAANILMSSYVYLDVDRDECIYSPIAVPAEEQTELPDTLLYVAYAIPNPPPKHHRVIVNGSPILSFRPELRWKTKPVKAIGESFYVMSDHQATPVATYIPDDRCKLGAVVPDLIG